MTRPQVRRRAVLFTPAALTGALLGGCHEGAGIAAPAPRAAPAAHAPGRIRGICFDLLALFDPRSVARRAEALVPGRGAELCKLWQARQFEYSWLRASAGRYVDFRAITEEALRFALAELRLPLADGDRAALADAYAELEPWPDTSAALARFRQAGLLLAPLSNFSPRMLEAVVRRAKLHDLFTALLSTDAARTYKPDPRAYALGPAALGLPPESIAFAAFGGWDAAGAKWFGFPTFWLNRLGAGPEALGPGPDAVGTSLAELAAFIDARAV